MISQTTRGHIPHHRFEPISMDLGHVPGRNAGEDCDFVLHSARCDEVKRVCTKPALWLSVHTVNNTMMANFTFCSQFGHTGSNTKTVHFTSRFPLFPSCQQHQDGPTYISVHIWPYWQQHQDGPLHISFPIWTYWQQHHCGSARISFPFLSILRCPVSSLVVL